MSDMIDNKQDSAEVNPETPQIKITPAGQSTPPPHNDGFFASAHTTSSPIEKKSGSSGCFWAMIITIIVITVIIVIGGVALVFVGVASFKSTIGEIGDGGFAPSKYQESFIAGNRNSGNKIAVVHVTGIISGTEEGGGFSGRAASASAINKKLRHILKDNSVKAMVVRIDSPGGEVTASDEIYHMLQKIHQERKIPIVASMGSLAASGGYYIAVGCDYIIAHRMTTTGSIGVIIQTYKYYELFQKIGVKGEAYTSGPMKDMLSGERPTTPYEQEVVKKLLNTIYCDFVKVVAAGRPKLTEDKIKNTIIGDGRIFLGSEALTLGLVDELGYFEDAVKKAATMAKIENDFKVVSLNEPFTLASLFGQMETSEKAMKIELPGTSSGMKLEKGKIYMLPKDMIEMQ